MAKTFLVTVTNDLNQDQRMHRICDTLAAEGYEVLLLGRIRASSSPLLDHAFDQKRLKCLFSKGILFYLEYNIRILFFALNFKPDVIYSVDLDTLLGGGLATRILKNKQIHDAHEYFVEMPELESKGLKKRIWNFIGWKFVPGCNLCFTVNKELAEILGEKYKNEFHVIRSVPSLIQKDKVENRPNDVPVILYQGVLNKGRGLEEAIEAISKLEEKVVFKIAGEGDLSDELRALSQRLNAEDRVKFLGWLSPNELKEETSKADIGLNLLSGTSLNYKYSLANKFFDYMHAGVASINMDFPVYRRICGQYEVGLCLASLDQELIQKAVFSLISNKEKISHIKKACELAKSEYNWDKESKTLVELINKYV